LQVAILSFSLTAWAGMLGSITVNMAAMKAYRCMAFSLTVRHPFYTAYYQ
jgi:protein-S-isoprenylcysteine O-methyltransferase Ste14